MSAPHTFLTLSSETSEPFVIPNVSPTSSPFLMGISGEPTVNALENFAVEAGRNTRSMSVIELN